MTNYHKLSCLSIHYHRMSCNKIPNVVALLKFYKLTTTTTMFGVRGMMVLFKKPCVSLCVLAFRDTSKANFHSIYITVTWRDNRVNMVRI